MIGWQISVTVKQATTILRKQARQQSRSKNKKKKKNVLVLKLSTRTYREQCHFHFAVEWKRCRVIWFWGILSHRWQVWFLSRFLLDEKCTRAFSFVCVCVCAFHVIEINENNIKTVCYYWEVIGSCRICLDSSSSYTENFVLPACSNDRTRPLHHAASNDMAGLQIFVTAKQTTAKKTNARAKQKQEGKKTFCCWNFQRKRIESNAVSIFAVEWKRCCVIWFWGIWSHRWQVWFGSAVLVEQET